LAWQKRQQAVWPPVVPQTVTIDPVDQPDEVPPRVVYVGNLTWHPNVAGLDWLCQKVWPLLRAQLPQATLTIAGSGLGQAADGSLAVPAAWRGPGIEVVGFVPELRAFVAGAAAMAAPVFGGSGVRIKLLDSLRLGVPTVTTRDGASGLPLRDDMELLCSDDARGFCDRLVRLCQDGGLRRRLSQAGLAFLREQHSRGRAERGLRMALGLSGGR
jgi:glycosyltransferase involved in cell wall biosynthesis